MFKLPVALLSLPLQELLGDSGQQLAYLIRSQPTVLLHSLQSMHSKMDELEGLLQMDRQQLCYTVSRVPALLQLAPESIAVKLTKSAQVGVCCILLYMHSVTHIVVICGGHLMYINVIYIKAYR